MLYLLCLFTFFGDGLSLPKGTLIDLTHPFDKDAIYWPTAEGFKIETVSAGYTDAGFYYAANNYKAAEHGGTHLDAPIHFAEGRHTADQIPLERLMGPAAVVDVSQFCLQNKDYLVRIQDIMKYEAEHGELQKGTILLLHTGFGRFWPDRKRYMGTDERGPEAVAKLHFPGLHPDTAEWLVKERDIAAIGLDTPSIDYGQSKLFKAHQILFKDNIPAFENVANLHKLPPSGAVVIALPMKIKDGSGGPLRIIAIAP